MRSLLFFTFVLSAAAGAMGCGSDAETDADPQLAQTPIPSPTATDDRPPAPGGAARLAPVQRSDPGGDVQAAGAHGVERTLFSARAAWNRDLCASSPRLCAEVESVPQRGAP